MGRHGRGVKPGCLFQNERSIGSEATVRDQEQWGSALDGVVGARVMLDLDSTSDYVKELCYTFAPRAVLPFHS